MNLVLDDAKEINTKTKAGVELGEFWTLGGAHSWAMTRLHGALAGDPVPALFC